MQMPGEALLNHRKDVCKVTLLESVQETLHITSFSSQCPVLCQVAMIARKGQSMTN